MNAAGIPEPSEMDVFNFRNQIIDDYSEYVRSFIQIRDQRILNYVDGLMAEGVFWPDPLIQPNPTFTSGGFVDELVKEGVLHTKCADIFRKDKVDGEGGSPLRLQKHQAEAIRPSRNRVVASGNVSSDQTWRADS
jgi:hypothetical protein